MIKTFLSFIVVLVIISCKTNTVTVDYFGQIEPETNPIIFAEDIISVKGRFENGISFTPDRRELAFGILNKDDLSGDIYYSNKSDNKWNVPEFLEQLKNESVYHPYFSPDGKALLYSQSKTSTENWITDIWMLKKKNNLWVQQKKVHSPISTLVRESTACMTLDNKIYFSSNRNGNGLADLYYSSLENGEYSNAERIDSICSEKDEESVFVSANDSFLILCRYTEENGPDLFISYRDFKGTWMPPTLLDSKINTSDWERRPYVTIDNKFLFFTRQEFKEYNLIESDIYWVNTSKVFKPFVYNLIPVTSFQIGVKFELQIPVDYFKDIDDKQLTLSINQNEFDWLEFDSEKMILSGLPTLEGDFELIFTAIDKVANMTKDRIKITVTK